MEYQVDGGKFGVEEIYERLIFDKNIDEMESDGKRTVVLGPKFSSYVLLNIELFVNKIISKEKILPFKCKVDGSNPVVVQSSALAKYFQSFNLFVDEYSEEKIFSVNVTLFFDCINLLGLMDLELDKDHNFYYPGFHKIGATIFNEIVEKIHDGSRVRAFKRKVYSREYNSKRNFENVKKYVAALFENYSRMLVLRFDLGFRKDCGGGIVAIDAAQKYLKRFLNNRRSNSIFNDEVGYVWKLEHGIEKGFHFHFFFFLDGSKACKDEYRTYKIGEYWEEVTAGRGYSYSCNAVKRGYNKIGIGMLSHFDHEMRNNFLLAMNYFFKEEQFLKEKFRKKTRVYGRGEMPSKRTNALGRPRRE